MSAYFDYSSAPSSFNSNVSSWWRSPQRDMANGDLLNTGRQPSSYESLLAGTCTLEDIMKDFQLNGCDAEYTPMDEDKIWSPPTGLNGMGPSSRYIRQKSWPEPERTPIQMLPKPASDWAFADNEFNPNEFTATSTPVQETNNLDFLWDWKRNILNTLPNSVLFYMLQQLELSRGGYKHGKPKVYNECRFCKNNGERESYYRSHTLKDTRGRVLCPVLRAYVCARCGARGDFAHTAKYCPLATPEERVNCTAMMRSVRMASGRRRKYFSAPSDIYTNSYMTFGDTTPSAISDTKSYHSYATTPLEPQWAALEQKLML